MSAEQSHSSAVFIILAQRNVTSQVDPGRVKRRTESLAFIDRDKPGIEIWLYINKKNGTSATES